ncbi:MAG: D-alanine--D-alanine ligase [Gammaproteobacteria bacterium]|nr:D-alanine--D-alanine ligase [Gammaproteobacteria bacterium]
MRKQVTDPKAFGRVAVLMGGWSSERQVSLWSGQAVFEALKRKGVDATAVDVDQAKVLALKSEGFDRAFIVLHGPGGEDGMVQAALELQGIPYTGSGMTASAIKMDKVQAKRIWKAEGLPTADFAVLRSAADAQAAAQRFGYPFVVKPATEGSSVGVTIVKKPEQVADAYTLALGEGRSVMAERFVKGAEMTVAVLDGEALPSIRIVPAGEFYDYHAKYISDDTKYHCPSGATPEQEKQLAQIAVRAFELIGARGWGRVDFIVEGAAPGASAGGANPMGSPAEAPGASAGGANPMGSPAQPWLLEINTVPGMTSHSLVPMAARARGIDFDALCWAILETSL